MPTTHLTGASYAGSTQQPLQADTVGNLLHSPEQTDRQYGAGGQLRQANGTRYRYDAEGNLVRKTLPNGKTWHYAWNGAGQLVSVTRPDGALVTFAYDALGRHICKRYKGKVTRWIWDGNKPLHEWTELELDGRNTDDIITWLFEENTFAPLAKLAGQKRYSIGLG